MTTTFKKPAPPKMTETLAEFTAQIDSHLGRPSGFASAVVEYRRARDEAAALSAKSEVRTKVKTHLDKLIETGAGYVGGRQIKAVRRGGGTKVVLRSAVVEKAYPELWAAARIPSFRLEIKTGLSGPPRIVVPPFTTTAETWAAYEQLRNRATVATRKAESAKTVLDAVFDEVSDVWNGEVRLTADGWMVGRSELARFDAARCRALAEQREIDLSSVESIETTAGSLVYVLADDSVDEIDGD